MPFHRSALPSFCPSIILPNPNPALEDDGKIMMGKIMAGRTT
jgi:hypothetical protein